MQYMPFEGPGFKLQFPTTWRVLATPQFQAMFVAPANEYSDLRANFAIAMRGVTEDITAVSVAEEALNNQQEQYPEYKVLAENDYGEESGNTFRRDYTWLNKQQNTVVKQSQIFLVYRQVLFTITATRPLKDTNTEPIFENMLSSFELVVSNA